MRPAFLVALVLAPSLSAQSAADLLSKTAIPDLFAGLMNVTLSEQISGASFRVDNRSSISDATRFQTFKLPWKEEFALGSRGDALHLGATAGVLLAQDALHLDTTAGFATVDEDWTALGGQLEVGWSRPIGRGWRLRPGLGFGLAYIRNDTSYNEAGRAVLAPILDEVLVNWDAWAASGSGSLTLEHPRAPDRFSAGFVGRYTLTGTRTFAATSDLQEGGSTSQLLAGRGDLGGPTGWIRNGEPVHWELFGAWTGLHDIDASVLGFDELFELGAGLSLSAVRRLPTLHFRTSWIFGPDISGFSLGLSFAL